MFQEKILNILLINILIHFCLHTCNTFSQLLYVSKPTPSLLGHVDQKQAG